MVLAGYNFNGYSYYNFALTRYLADGNLDTSFGSGGKVTTDMGGNKNDFGSALALQPDGKLVAAGYSDSFNFALVRYLADGNLDTSFGSDGKVTTNFGANGAGKALVLQPDGFIVVAGYSNGDFALARYLADGSLDPSFGTGGSVTTDFGSDDEGKSVALQPDGRIVVAGYSNGNFALARYLADGSLDPSFGNGGIVTTDFGAGDVGQSVTLQPDGRIVVAGYSYIGYGNDDIALARYLADGSLDPSFGTGGIVTTDFGSDDEGKSVALQPDGRIVVAGIRADSNSHNPDFALVRYRTDGLLESHFGPVEDTLAPQPGINEQGAVVLGPSAQILDPQLAALGHYDGATLTLRRQGGANAEDEFSATIGGSLTVLTPGSYFAIDSVTIGRVVTNSGGTLQLRFLGTNATQARVDKALQQIAYRNSSDRPPAQALMDWTFDDGNTGAQGTGGALSTTGTVTVNISPQNDWPQWNKAPPPQTAVANVAFSYTLPADTFNDPDGDPLTWNLAMADGTGMPPWLNFNPATRILSGTPTEFDIGTLNLRVTVTDPANATEYADFSLQVVPGVLMGLAAQGYVGTDNAVQFGAFTIQGDSRRVLIRGLGPALNGYVPGAIGNPKIALSINGALAPLEVNDDWADADNADEILALKHQPKNETESAILRTLEPGVYNVHLSGSGGSTGIGMFQVYAVEGGGNGELKGLAAQGQVGTGNQVQFGAFTITGAPRKVLIRGLGPALDQYVPNAIRDPKIALSVNGADTPLEVNDDWADADNVAEIMALKHQPKNATESAILRTLEPGVYNVHLSGSGGTEGIGMFQVYTVE